MSKQTEDVAMTAADQLRQEGRAETTYKLVKGALKLGMDAKTIADTFEIGIGEVKTIIEKIEQEQI